MGYREVMPVWSQSRCAEPRVFLSFAKFPLTTLWCLSERLPVGPPVCDFHGQGAQRSLLLIAKTDQTVVKLSPFKSTSASLCSDQGHSRASFLMELSGCRMTWQLLQPCSSKYLWCLSVIWLQYCPVQSLIWLCGSHFSATVQR